MVIYFLLTEIYLQSKSFLGAQTHGYHRIFVGIDPVCGHSILVYTYGMYIHPVVSTP